MGGVAGTCLPDGVISPGGIGFDINCAVRLLRTPWHHDEIRHAVETLVHEISRSIPSGFGRSGRWTLDRLELDRVLTQGCPYLIHEHGLGTDDDLEFIESNGAMAGADSAGVSERAKDRGESQLGTLGSGNRFLELQVVDAIYDEPPAMALGLSIGLVMVMIHSAW